MFKCISCRHEIIYSSVESGTDEEECANCGRSYWIESIVENETYDPNFESENDQEFIEVLAVYTEMSNALKYIEND